MEALGHVGTVVGHNAAVGDVALEMVVPQCARQACGDALYRSTLDAELRREVKELTTPGGLAILGVLATYLSLPPRVGSGALDYYVLGPLQRARQPRVSRNDFAVTKTLGKGGFGTVYLAEATRDILDRFGKVVFAEGAQFIAKEAREYGQAEVWMNERASRAAGEYVAKFRGTFAEDPPPTRGGGGLGQLMKGGDGEEEEDVGGEEGPLWLLWEYESEETLRSLLKSPDFPYDVEEAVLGVSYEGKLPRGPARALLTTRVICKQILEAVAALHATGIVHRDVKPENILFVRNGGEPGAARLKLIDLGAAADLKTGRNYVPREYLLDPRYAPPEEYVMSTDTAEPPPEPIAALLSPVLWQLNLPDRFDMFSLGVLFMQIACPNLRSDNGLSAFRRALAAENSSVRQWREEMTRRAASTPASLDVGDFLRSMGIGGSGSRAEVEAAGDDRVVPRGFEEGFAVLDASPDGKAESTLWYAIRKLIREKPETRASCAEVLGTSFFAARNMAAPSAAALAAFASASESEGGAAEGAEGASASSSLAKKSGTTRLLANVVYASADDGSPEAAKEESGQAPDALRWIGRTIARSGTAEGDGFTEAEVQALYEAQQMQRMSSKAPSATPSEEMSKEFLGKAVATSIAGRVRRGESVPTFQTSAPEPAAPAEDADGSSTMGGEGGTADGGFRRGLRSGLIGLGLGNFLLGKNQGEMELDIKTKAGRR